jgi:hypothetical protein
MVFKSTEYKAMNASLCNAPTYPIMQDLGITKAHKNSLIEYFDAEVSSSRHILGSRLMVLG